MNSIQRKNLALSRTAFELVKDVLPEGHAETIRGYIYDFNEWGLGMETVVDALLEGNIAVTAEQREAIFDAMNAMNLDRSQRNIRVID